MPRGLDEDKSYHQHEDCGDGGVQTVVEDEMRSSFGGGRRREGVRLSEEADSRFGIEKFYATRR